MPLALGSGPADVLETGVVDTFFGHPLTLLLVVPEGRWVVEISFATDPGVEDVAVETVNTDDGLQIRCINFDSAAGRGTAVPALLGELGDHLLFFHFRAFRYGRSTDHTVQYTFYRAAKRSVDWSPVV